MANVTEVVSFELDTARDDFAVDVTIRLRRHPEGIKYFGNEPTSEDLPVDFALALVKWLAMGDSKRVVGSTNPCGHDGCYPNRCIWANKE